METNIHPKPQSQHQPHKGSNDNNDKETSAINEFRVRFTSHIQSLMMQQGISRSECEWSEDCPTCLNFVHMALLCSLQSLHEMKNKLSYDISEEEYTYLNLLTVEGSLNEDPKLDAALNSFNEGLAQYLKKIMLDAGYEDSETEEDSILFISFASKVLIMKAKKLLRYKSALSENHDTTKKRKNYDIFKGESSSLFFEDINLSLCSMKVVAKTRRHCVYCVSTPDGLIALKTMNEENPTTQDTQNLDNELKIGSQINYHAFRKSYFTTVYQNKKALLLEWARGNPLSNVTKFTVSEFFPVAREIVSSLNAMHSNEICHLSLTCDHVIFDSENSVKIIGFGSSSSFYNKRSHNTKLLQRDLRYISPEQTGRVNREEDFRSDFYSLGIIFYRLLAGRYPFDSQSAIKTVQMHILQEPTPLHQIDPNVPLPLSRMISKLMEKNVDFRYQSAKGLIYDIDLIMSEYKPGVELLLGEHDISDRFILSQKLYGRSNEYGALLSVYNRIVSLPSFEVVFVKGDSGMGKTALTMELSKDIMKKGNFIFGKYDCSKSEPYSALIEAVKMFCDMILLEDEYTIEKYRSMIQDAVGEEGKLLTNVIDNLHIIIGEQSDIFESFGREAKNRFNYVFIKFLRVITSVSCPLVLVLEDLQWIDLASLDLIISLVESSMKNLMLIGIYRNNEVGDKHKLVQFLNAVKKMNLSTTEITLNNMDHECINEFISNALRVPPLDSYPLTALVYKKTEGNPFFVKQMLNDLREQKIITFSPEKCKWQWNDCIDKAHDITESVLDLLRRKIQSLDKYAQHALTIASYLGSPFSLSTLRLIINNKKAVENALASGMITEKGCGTCCFVHDQVQHAANSLLPKNNRKPVLLYVAKKLWKLFSADDLKDNICVVVDLFESAKDVINKNERIEVAELFLLAGEKAMASVAPDKAFKYFTSGIELLHEDGWKKRYKLSLKMYCSAAKSASWLMDYKSMKEFIDIIFNNATDSLDLVTPYLILIRMQSDKRMYGDAMKSASSILKKFVENFDPDMSTSATEILQTKHLVGASVESILEMKQMDNKKLLSVIEILDSILYSAFYSGNRHVLDYLSVNMVQLTLKHGLSKYSSTGFCCFAVVLRAIGDKASYDVGKLSLELLKKSNAKEMIPTVNSCIFTLISPFFGPLRSSLTPLRSAALVSLEIGSHHYSISSVSSYSLLSFFGGKSLSKLLDEMTQFDEVLLSKKKVYLAMYQATLNLHSDSITNPAKLIGENFDYNYCFDEDGEKYEIVRTSVISCVIAYLFYDFETASKLLYVCRSLKKYINFTFSQVIFYFYDGLITSAMARNEEKKEKFIAMIEDDISNLKQFAENAPENFLNKVLLLEAELAVMQKKELQAKSRFQKAISLSKEHGLVNEEALACERAAMFYLDLDSQQEAKELLLHSLNCYKVWGANSKVSHLSQRYPFLVTELKASSNSSNKNPPNLNANDDSTDSVSVLTDDLSSLSIWHEQKRVKLSIDDKDKM